MLGVLDNKQLPERRTLVPRVVGVTCRWCHVSHHHGREGKATLRTLKFQISNSNGELAGSPIAASKIMSGFYAQPSPINSEGQSAFSTIAYEDSSFCRALPKTADDNQAKDLEDQCRQLPRSVDAAGSAASTSSVGSSSSGEATGPRDRTPDHLSGLSDISSGSDHATPTKLGRATQARPVSVVDLAAEGGNASERTASQASTSGRSGDVASDSTDPSGEEIHARQRLRSRGARVNDMKVYRRADAEMVELAGDRPVYTADYYTSAVTLRYLAALRREFSIPDDVDLVVPGPNDLPSRPPSGYIALSAEYFRAGLRLPFHPFLRRALTSLNVSPAQLNANAYRILVGCYVLWAAKFSETLPLFAFQNLYRMKTAPSSKGFYYFQGFKRTFITGCPDSDKQFKHLWFYAGGRWLQGHLSYFELPPSERVPVAFRRGYVWTRAPHTPTQTLTKIEELRELSGPERSQHKLLSEGSLKEYWVCSSSTSGRPDDQPRTAPPRVTIARMPEPAVHNQSRTSRPVVASADVRSGVPRGVPKVTVCGSSSGDPTSGAWGPRVTDEDLDLVIRELFPARGLRIEEPMAARRGTKRPSNEERIAWLQKNVRLGKGKGKEGATAVPPSGGAVSTAAPAKTAALPVAQTSRPPSRPELRTDRSREERPREERPREDRSREDRQPSRHEVRSGRSREDRPTVLSPAPRSGRDEASPESSIHRVQVSRFSDQLSTEVAESSKRSDHVAAISDSTAKLIETLCILFSGSAAAKEHANRMADEVKAAEANARSSRRSEKEARTSRGVAEEARREVEARAKAAEEELRCVEQWAKKAERDSEEVETSRLEMEAAKKTAEQELAAARAEHKRYLEVAFPAALADARVEAVEEFLRSEDFRARLVSEYQEGMRDMKAGFIAANPSLVGVDWSFVSEKSEETAVEGAVEEGEVTGAAPAPENVVVLDDPDQPEAPDQAVAAEQPAADQPTSPALDVSMSDLFPDQLD
ncbi:hypothetical protein TIFTF001_044685 [Ficus carica]|uniref:Uncharacterized protein n=1 Tax=Ficus carica TaxID=3494 RepID=A0AA87Z8V2_FICCA|nr:hypothetical protein TIFTF001_043191 [Ficus carica]GMN20870.1 hypothetical protein TIFTF001_043193 [Ficus carica]GMN32383.1 hypothetical protein TIFTF001_044680 [Ficus carica]GMN32400.1 hypothetical protein TIFTF001_044681 [Ficus carica]GMN32418.1 hypothetical protein TIFTF001_044684 [Ficus carica]